MKQKKLTQKEIDAIDNYGTPLKPQPELPSDAMNKKKKMMGGMMSDGVSKKGMGVEKRMGGGMMSDGVANKGSGIEMKSKGGMVRGQGIALRGTKFKGIF